MIVHSGYPELYLPLMEKLDSACSGFLDEEAEIEKIENFIKQYKWKLDDHDQGDIQNKEAETLQDVDAKSDKSSTDQVVKVAPKFKYKGLVNMGNTCYMNSFLQALYMTPVFRS